MAVFFKGLINVVPYATGENTGDVGEKLEDKYKIIERFYEFIAKDLEEKFLFFWGRERDLIKGLDNALFLTSDWLTNQFREYLEMEKHGIKTKASENDPKGPRPSFIDTARYYKSVRIVLERS